MLVSYDEKFDEKRDALAAQIRKEDPTYSENEAQQVARLMLLKKMAKKAYGSEKQSTG